MAAAFNKFNAFVAELAAGNFNFGSDSLKAMLTNTAPLATNALYSDISANELANGNGYVTGGIAVSLTSSGQSGGVYKLVEGAVTLTASGGNIGPFRYVVLWDATSSKLIGWWDMGASITLLGSGPDQFVFTPDAVNGTIQIA